MKIYFPQFMGGHSLKMA